MRLHGIRNLSSSKDMIQDGWKTWEKAYPEAPMRGEAENEEGRTHPSWGDLHIFVHHGNVAAWLEDPTCHRQIAKGRESTRYSQELHFFASVKPILCLLCSFVLPFSNEQCFCASVSTLSLSLCPHLFSLTPGNQVLLVQ